MAFNVSEAKEPLYTQYIAPVDDPTFEKAVIKGENYTGKGITFTRYVYQTGGGYYNNYYVEKDGVKYWAFNKWYAFSSCPQSFTRSAEKKNRYLYSPPFYPETSTAAYEFNSTSIENWSLNHGWDTSSTGAAYVQKVHTNWLYTISFDSNGGSGTMADQEIIDSGTLAANKFTRTGYTFSGWKCGYTSYPDGANITPTDDMKLVAQWTVNRYTISGTAASTGGGYVTGGGTYDYGTTVTLRATPSTGWLFDSWSNGSTSPEITVTVTGNATYTAKFKQITYRLAFDPNGSDVTGSMPTNTYTYGTENTLPANRFVRAGYDFKGWATSAGSNWSFADGAGLDVPGTVFNGAEPGELRVLYAYWEGHPYEVTFDRDGGSGGDKSVIVNSGDAMPRISTPSRTGYEFSGYYTEKNKTGVKYYNADGTSAKNFDLGANVTLYAGWSAKKVTVTFDGNEGNTPSPVSKIVTYGEKYAELATVTRGDESSGGYTTHYEFAGWFTAKDGGDRITADTTVLSEDDHSLYARWESVSTANVYTVTLDAMGGVVTPSEINVTYDDEYAALPVPVKTGYKFVGWYDGLSNLVENTTKVAATSNHVLYAHWSTYVVTYNANGGEFPAGHTTTNLSCILGEKYPADIPIPSRNGCTFAGWWTEAGVQKTFLDDIEEDALSLSARWKGIAPAAGNVTVEFDFDNEMTDTVSKSVPAGSSLRSIEPSNVLHAVNEKYMFVGWFSGDEYVDPDTVIESDMTLVAKWSERVYNEFFGYDDIIFTSGDYPWYPVGGKMQSEANLDVYTESVLNVQFIRQSRLSFDWSVSSSTIEDSGWIWANDFSFGKDGESIFEESGVVSGHYSGEVDENVIYSWMFYKLINGDAADIATISNFVCTRDVASSIDEWDSAVELGAAPTNAVFETGGATNWVVTEDIDVVDAGYNAIAITNLAAGRSSWARMTVKGAGELRFKWKVSCESGYVDTDGSYRKCDYLEFCDGDQEVTFIDGEEGYVEVVYTNAVDETHTFTWRYVKDGSDSAGDDAAYVDSVTWTPVESVNPAPTEADRPVISAVTRTADGGLSLTVSNASSLYRYELLGSDKLSTPLENWPVIETKDGIDGPLEFTGLVKPDAPSMFYYIRVTAK